MLTRLRCKLLVVALGLAMGIALVPSTAQAAPSVQYVGSINSATGYFNGRAIGTGLRPYGTARVHYNGVQISGGSIAGNGTATLWVSIAPPPRCGARYVYFRTWHYDANDRYVLTYEHRQLFSSLCANGVPTGEVAWSKGEVATPDELAAADGSVHELHLTP